LNETVPPQPSTKQAFSTVAMATSLSPSWPLPALFGLLLGSGRPDDRRHPVEHAVVVDEYRQALLGAAALDELVGLRGEVENGRSPSSGLVIAHA
jgi:hypothetical protein